MNFNWFIAKKIIFQRTLFKGYSKPILIIGISAIAIGITSMLIALGTGIGLQKKISEKISMFNGQVLVTDMQNMKSHQTLKSIENSAKITYDLNKLKSVNHVQNIGYIGGLAVKGGTFEGIIFKGIDSTYNKKFNYFLKNPTEKKSLKTNEIWISKNLSKKFGVGIDDFLQIYFYSEDILFPKRRTLKIKSLFETEFSDYDKNFIIGHIEIIRSILNWNKSQVGGLEIFLDSKSSLEKKTEEIYDSIEDFLSVRSVNEQFSEIYSWINLFNYNISLIIIIMIFVGGINMITSLLALIIEQTNMIATVRILGSSIKSVQKIFLIQGAYLITIGLFFGNVIGLSLLIIQDFTGIISLNPETYYVKKVPVYINFSSVLLINLITFFSCMLFLLIPTYVITKMSPIKSISLNK